jgi:hypothetical protein
MRPCRACAEAGPAYTIEMFNTTFLCILFSSLAVTHFERKEKVKATWKWAWNLAREIQEAERSPQLLLKDLRTGAASSSRRWGQFLP